MNFAGPMVALRKQFRECFPDSVRDPCGSTFTWTLPSGNAADETHAERQRQHRKTEETSHAEPPDQ
jgi:hypothetical protein